MVFMAESAAKLTASATDNLYRTNQSIDTFTTKYLTVAHNLGHIPSYFLFKPNMGPLPLASFTFEYLLEITYLYHIMETFLTEGVQAKRNGKLFKHTMVGLDKEGVIQLQAIMKPRERFPLDLHCRCKDCLKFGQSIFCSC